MTLEEMSELLTAVRDAKYPSKLAHNGARLDAIETVVLKLLTHLQDSKQEHEQ